MLWALFRYIGPRYIESLSATFTPYYIFHGTFNGASSVFHRVHSMWCWKLTAATDRYCRRDKVKASRIKIGRVTLVAILGNIILSILVPYPFSLCRSFEDRAPVDSIYGCPIFIWVAETCLTGETLPGQWHQQWHRATCPIAVLSHQIRILSEINRITPRTLYLHIMQ